MNGSTKRILGVLTLPAVAQAQSAGQTIYSNHCAACHQPTGLGIAGAFPALAGSKVVKGPSPAVIAQVLHGRNGIFCQLRDLIGLNLVVNCQLPPRFDLPDQIIVEPLEPVAIGE